MDILHVTIDGKHKYKLQHPGVREWLKAKKKLTSIIYDGDSEETILEVNNEQLFDYSFGKTKNSPRVVFADGDNDWVDWGAAGFERNGIIPAMSELQEVWAIVLNRFLGGKPTEGERFKFHQSPKK